MQALAFSTSSLNKAFATLVSRRNSQRLLQAVHTRFQAAASGASSRPSEVSIVFENGGATAVLSLGGNGSGNGSAPAANPTFASSGSDEAELKELAAQFDCWNAALQTGNPETVAALYAPDAVLLPTVSNQVRTDRAGKVDYFTAFLQLKPFGTINERHVRFLSPARDVGINSGVYTFDIVKEGQPEKVQARYSFVYRKIDGEWKITEHHSSAMPEPVADPLKDVAAQFDRWNAALQTGDPEQVAALYAPDGVLLPTVSNVVRTCHQGKVDYFTAFLQLKPRGTIDESHVRFLSPDHTLACNSGVYTFDIVKEGQPQKVQARYSFVYRKIDGQWKIAEHHSSAMPEPVAPVVEEEEFVAA